MLPLGLGISLILVSGRSQHSSQQDTAGRRRRKPVKPSYVPAPRTESTLFPPNLSHSHTLASHSPLLHPPPSPPQNGLTVSGYIQRMGLLTLPDLFKRKYGSLMEVIVSIIEMCSFTFLLAGNLVGVSLLLQFVFGLPKLAGIACAGVLMVIYTAVGGLFSIAYVDLLQVGAGGGH